MDAWEQIAALRRQRIAAVVITITSVRGSVPGRTGSKAVVTADGRVTGNLGGGKVEARAVDHALTLLGGTGACEHLTWNLQRDVGMTCGGEMSFLFEPVSAVPAWHIVIFGAGHVSQALVPILATLDCRIDVIDTRGDWLALLPVRANVSQHRVDAFEAGVGHVSQGAFVLSITRGHQTDRPVLFEVLNRFPGIPFLGVIGSASKRAVLIRELREQGVADALLEKIICPVGLPVGGNDPAEIAISIAAQLLEKRN